MNSGGTAQPFLFLWRLLFVWLVLIGCKCEADQELLSLPARSADAPGGREFAKSLEGLDLRSRDAKIADAILSGNVPDFLRRLVRVTITNNSATPHIGTFYVTPDYLAVGSDSDYFLVSITPETAQRIAAALNCSLPTPLMVNAIYRSAKVKLEPRPIPPGPTMTTVPVFLFHNDLIRTQRFDLIQSAPLGSLVVGHKKDVVIVSKLATTPGKVAIYGWHKTNGEPIQPLYLGHASTWVDYSQGVRLVLQKMAVDGKPNNLAEVLQSPELSPLLSDDGPITDPGYPTNQVHIGVVPLSEFAPTGSFNERTATFMLDPEVRVHINVPIGNAFNATNFILVFFALPNGNTIEQTIGKKTRPQDDWHYNIQHIGAQVRFLRHALPDKSIVVTYLESGSKSWPAWRKKHGDTQIPEILRSVQNIFQPPPSEIVLASHSGGGSLIFGYLNVVQEIPRQIGRLIFIDSNYAYDRSLGHCEKLVEWLTNSPSHCLNIFAYNDVVALLDGKPFVSAAGGTWGKSHEMQKDLARVFSFNFEETAEFENYSALERRVQFLLRKNPDRKILHTVQVELNGFIHGMLTTTPLENQGYAYFGPRAYEQWISDSPK